MKNDLDLSEARVYVGTYRKYNEGSIEGAWLDLNRFSNKKEFYRACAKLHKDEDDPEYMFQDYENVPESLIAESWMSDNLFEVLEVLREIEEERLKPFLVWCNNHHHDLSTADIDELISAFEDDYIGKYDSEEDYAYELVREREDLSEFARTYFNYEAYAKDLFCGDYWMEDGYVFRSS